MRLDSAGDARPSAVTRAPKTATPKAVTPRALDASAGRAEGSGASFLVGGRTLAQVHRRIVAADHVGQLLAADGALHIEAGQHLHVAIALLGGLQLVAPDAPRQVV